MPPHSAGMSDRPSPRPFDAAPQYDCSLRLRLQPLVDILTHRVLGDSVAFLDFAFQLIALTIDLREIIVGELTPLLFDLALGGLPISFDSIPIHFQSSSGIYVVQLTTLYANRRFRFFQPILM